jgi:prolipoprotein diacylglyceryltransferase
MSTRTISYHDVVYEVLYASNRLVMEYVRSADPNYLLRALELQADGIKALQNLLMNIEEAKPCPN